MVWPCSCRALRRVQQKERFGLRRNEMKKAARGALALVLTAAVAVAGGGISFFGEGGAAEAAEGQADDTYGNVTFTRQSVHDPSIVPDGKGTYYAFGSHMDIAKSTDLMKWQRVTNQSTNSPLYGVVDESGKVVKASYEQALKKNQITGDTGLKDANGNAVIFDTYNINNWIFPNPIRGCQWAPDVMYNDKLGKWCMYESFCGPAQNSVIALFTADDIEGPYVYQGPIVFTGFQSKNNAKNGGYKKTDLEIVLGKQSSLPAKYDKGVINEEPWGETWGDYWPHAIDPCVLYDDAGKLWMIYGSWSGGIYALELDEATGLRDYSVKYGSDYSSRGKAGVTDEYFGKKIAGGYYVTGEGPYIEKIGKYYYLFLSYGELNPTGGYNMRVFRSEKLDGPYVDGKGTSAIYTAYMDNYRLDSRGLQVMGNYQWGSMSKGEVAQGHNSVYYEEKTGKTYLVYHTKFNDGSFIHELRVHQLYINEDGWPVAAPYEYAGETVNDEAVKAMKVLEANVTGEYDLIIHQYSNPKANNLGTVGANLDVVKPVSITLNGDGTISGKYTGTWKGTAGTAYVTLTINNTEYKGVFTEQMVTGKKQKTICFSAASKSGRSIWGSKKQYSGSLMEAEATPMPEETPAGSPAVQPTEAPAQSPAAEPTETPAGSTEAPAEPTKKPAASNENKKPASVIKAGTKLSVKGFAYKVKSVGSTKTVQFIGASGVEKKPAKASVPDEVKLDGESYKVTSVAPRALQGNKRLKSLTIGKNVNTIGKAACKGCTKLTTVIIHTKKLTKKSVGSNAFQGVGKKAVFLVPKEKVSTYAAIVKAKGADGQVTVKQK